MARERAGRVMIVVDDFRYDTVERRVVELTDLYRERYLDRIGATFAWPEDQFRAALVQDLADNGVPVEALDGLDIMDFVGPLGVDGVDCFAGLLAMRALERAPMAPYKRGSTGAVPTFVCAYVGEFARAAREAVGFACWVAMGPDEEGDGEPPPEPKAVTPDARRWAAV